MKRTIQNPFLRGPAGRLEAMWELPADAHPCLVGLVCHPHPLHGGTMHNKVVHHTSMALQELKIPVLRFNFRGAGLSEGDHDGGRGEADDARAALSWLAEQSPDASIVLAGFSFGAEVGLRAGCDSSKVAALVGVGIPADIGDMNYLERCTKPKLFVQGTEDRFGSPQNVDALMQLAPEPKRLVYIAEADHFFNRKLKELRQTIVTELFWLLKLPEAS